MSPLEQALENSSPPGHHDLQARKFRSSQWFKQAEVLLQNFASWDPCVPSGAVPAVVQRTFLHHLPWHFEVLVDHQANPYPSAATIS